MRQKSSPKGRRPLHLSSPQCTTRWHMNFLRNFQRLSRRSRWSRQMRSMRPRWQRKQRAIPQLRQWIINGGFYSFHFCCTRTQLYLGDGMEMLNDCRWTRASSCRTLEHDQVCVVVLLREDFSEYRLPVFTLEPQPAM